MILFIISIILSIIFIILYLYFQINKKYNYESNIEKKYTKNNNYENNYKSNKDYKISIVMTCLNRKEQLINTLNSFNKYVGLYNFEVIIVDDNSNESNKINDIVLNYKFPIILKEISSQEKGDIVNPCIAFNEAFNLASGEIIIIQNAECLHYTNILQECMKSDLTNTYFTFSVLSSPSFVVNQFIKNNLDMDTNIMIEYLENVNKDSTHYYSKGWYNHPIYNNKNLHFCSVISRNNLDVLCGFDENYKNSYWYDDNEFLFRIQKFLSIENLNGLVIHQYHLNGSEEISKNNLNTEINKNKFNILQKTNKNEYITWNYGNSKIYKRKEKKIGFAVSIFSNNLTSEKRIERNIECIKSIINNVKNNLIILVIDEYINDNHYFRLKDLIKNHKNIILYKNKKSYGIYNIKNICMNLLIQNNCDYLCLLDDDLKITNNNICNYIINIFQNTNIPIISNSNHSLNYKLKYVNNIKFFEVGEYYGDFLCINKHFFNKHGYFYEMPFFWGTEHLLLTKKYMNNNYLENLVPDLSEYINTYDLYDHARNFDDIIKKSNENIIFAEKILSNIEDNFIDVDMNKTNNIEIICNNGLCKDIF